MRSRLLLVLCLGLAACIGDSEPDPLALRPTTSHPDSLLARLDARALETAFRQIHAVGYTAHISVVELSGDGSTPSFEHTIEVPPSSDPDTLHLQTSSQPSRIFDPVARLLPKEPPFQNAATREMYGVSRGPRDGPVVHASAERQEGSDPIQRAEVAVDTTTGLVVWAHVVRESQSAVFDEASEATVTLVQHDGRWWPAFGQLVTDLDVPLSDPLRRQLEWRVLSIGGVELAPDSTD